MVVNSSSVKEGAFLPPNSLAQSALIRLKIQATGLRSRMRNRSDPAKARTTVSAWLRQKLFGSISLTKNTMSVIATVVAPTEPGPHSRVANSVAREEQPMCMMLLPMSSVVSALSKCSEIKMAVLARALPDSAWVFRRILLQDAKAISAPAK